MLAYHMILMLAQMMKKAHRSCKMPTMTYLLVAQHPKHGVFCSETHVLPIKPLSCDKNLTLLDIQTLTSFGAGAM